MSIDPTYGCGYETPAQGSKLRKQGLPTFIVLVVIAYLVATGYNVVTIQNNLRNEKFLSNNGTAVLIELGSRLGLFQSLDIIDNALLGKDPISEPPGFCERQ
jgi:hypothetical protein